MHKVNFWFALVLAAILTACGSASPRNQLVAAADSSSEPIAPAQETSSPIPPTPTAEPTLVPTATSLPTATPAPTAEPPTPTIVDTNDTAELMADTSLAAASVPAAVTPAQPVRIQIPAIKLDYKPVSVGLDKNRVPIVPNHDVGWYNLSAMPGQGENIVFWGHVLRFKNKPKIPAPFARVKELKPGAEIIVTTANGEQARYYVTKAIQARPDQVQYILPTGKEQVTLVSCIGDNVISNGTVSKKYRLITIAEPAK